MSVDLRRSRSLSQDLIRPRVSFNRDVHIKRYGGKKQLGRIEEEEQDNNNSTIKRTTTTTTIPANIMKIRRGKTNANTSNASTTTSDIIDYNNTNTSIRRDSIDYSNNSDINTTMTSNGQHQQRRKQQNQTFGQKLKALFGGGGSGGSSTKKKQTVSTSTNTVPTTTDIDLLNTRYKEYRGQDYENKRGLSSTPDLKSNWFRSLDRQPKSRNLHRDQFWSDTTTNRYGTSKRQLRYFGESDTEAIRKPPLAPSLSNKTNGSTTLRRNHRFFADSTSHDDTTDLDTNGRSDSVLYLHTATVGHIPSGVGGGGGGSSERSSRLRSESRNTNHTNDDRKKTSSSSGRTVVRSVSVTSPWKPTGYHKVINYTNTDRVNHHKSTSSINRSGTNATTEKYGHLVFTGPSFDDQFKNNNHNNTYRNDRRRF